MSRHTLKHNKIFDKMVINEVTKVLGPGTPDEHSGKNMNWEMPYGTGTVTIHLIQGDRSFGSTLGSWLACRISDPNHIKEDGYAKAREDIPGGWPSYFTYPSGKCNLHVSPTDTEEDMKRDLAAHLLAISEPGSVYKDAFGEIEVESDIAPAAAF